MAGWRKGLATLLNRIEVPLDRARIRFRLDRGWLDPVRVILYRGYGTTESLQLRGRVVARLPIASATRSDSAWRNLRGMYRRFTGAEIPGAVVQVRFAGEEETVYEAVTDDEGFFAVDYTPRLAETGWRVATADLQTPHASGQRRQQATGQVLVPPPSATFGVISDIDDTIVRTGATSLLTMARVVLLGNAHTRLPFQGIATFYAALVAGQGGDEGNPLFYVSSGPWNLYDLLVEFLAINHIPAGPLFLQDWGLGRSKLVKTGHREHKLTVIDTLLAAYPDFPFVLIGDSGELDAEIYSEVARANPGRIKAIYIRDTQLEDRATAVRALAEQQRAGTTPLLLASDTVAAAEHAAQLGLIDPDALPTIRADKTRDLPQSPRAIWRRLLSAARRRGFR